MAITSCNALTGKHISMRSEFNSGSLLSGQLKVQDAPALGFWAASGSLDAALAGTVNAIGFVSGNLVSEVSVALAGRSAIQSDVDANQVVTDAVKTSLGGLVNGSGVYQAFSGTNYIDGNASVHADLSDLDAAIAAVQSDVNQNESDADSAIAAVQSDVNANEVVTDAAMTAMGGILNGSGVYQAFSGKNYINSNASVHADLVDLDAAIKIQELAIVSREAAISASYIAQIGATRASVISAVLDGAPDALDTLNELAAALGDDANYATTITNALAAKQTEIDALETSLGGLVNASGVYQAFSGKTYINGNGSVTEDLSDLDAALALVQADVNQNESDADAGLTAKQVVLDKHEAAMGAVFSAGGDYVAHSGKNYINANASVTADLIDLDQAIKDRADGLATLEGHLDNSNGFRVTSAAGNYRMSWGTNKPQMTMTLNADGETIDVCFDRGA